MNNINNYKEYDNNNNKPMITIKNLTKIFKNRPLFCSKNNKNDIHAVNNILIDMYNNEIFCLLGHNGSGNKS